MTLTPKTISRLLSVPTALMLSTVIHAENISRHIQIPAGQLSTALNRLAEASDLQMVYDADMTQGLKNPALNGNYTPTQALQKLLQGSGLGYQLADNGTVTISRQASSSQPQNTSTPAEAAVLPTVRVKSQAEYATDDPKNTSYNRTEASTATKTDTPIMETPFSVQVVTNQIVKDRQAVTIDKALDYVSGVTQGGFNQGTSDGFMLRGFQATNYYRDGVLMPVSFALATTKRETANLDSIEVLKGPGSLLYGRAEPGGIINVITKQPLSTPYYSAQQQFGSYNFYRTVLDATGPLTKDDTFLYRVNLSYENSGSFRDFIDNKKVFFAPVIKWNIGARTQATFEMEYQHFNTIQDSGIPPMNGRPAPVPRNLNLFEPFNNTWRGDSVLAGFNWSHEFNDNWKVTNKFMTQQIDMDNAYTSFVTFQPVQTNGDLKTKTVNFPMQKNENYFTTLNLIGKVKQGNLTHGLLFGFDYFSIKNMANINPTASPWQTNLFHPVYQSTTPTLDPAGQFSYSQTQSWYGLYFQDQVTLPFNVHLMGGLRYDNAIIHNNVTGLDSPTEDRVNPRGGVLWRPMQWLSFYGSYTENFGVSNGRNDAGLALPPQTAQQWETGIKTELFGGKLRSTLSYFDLTQQKIPASVDGTFYRAIGEAETRGLEFDTTGEILPGWNIIAAYSYMPYAKINKDDDGNQGHRLFGAPVNFGSLWNTYELQQGALRGLKFGAGVVGVGERQGNPENTYQVPGYVTMNLMTSYPIKIGRSKLTAQLNADNVLDKTYFVGTNSANQIQFGAPLTLMGSIKLEY